MRFCSSVVNVNPEQAKLWLSNNPNNRPINTLKVNKYAKMMKNGLWNFKESTPIQINKNEVLINGQHRLSAILQTGLTVKMRIQKLI